MEIEVRCAYPDALIYSNIEKNSRACSNWLKTSSAHDGHAVIVGGGPSVVDKMDIIKKRLALGQTVFALNGAGRFLNEHGIVPDYQVFLDCLPALTERIGEAKNFLIGSQCDPAMLEAIPNPILWHTAIPDVEKYLPEHNDGFNLIGSGGATVGLCALGVAYAMGYRKLHLFGYDSSNKSGKGHAYDVPREISGAIENLGGIPIGYISVTLNDKQFQSTLSMTRQAELFPGVCNALMENGCIVTLDVDENSLMAEVLRMMNSMQKIAA